MNHEALQILATTGKPVCYIPFGFSLENIINHTLKKGGKIMKHVPPGT